MRGLTMLIALAVAAPALTMAAPALAQSTLKGSVVGADGTQPRKRIIDVFGTDLCPKARDKDEIVVCVRHPDEERYRIPSTVRGGQGKPLSPFATRRERLVAAAAGGAGGSIGSCTPVGSGGGTGCNQQLQDAYREEKKPR